MLRRPSLASRITHALAALATAVLVGPVAAFEYGVLYRFGTQALIAEPGRADTAWHFAADKDGGSYPRTDVPLREGGFSDLLADPSDPSGHTFWTVQDRGVAVSYDGDSDSAFKVFAFPGHHQKILRVRVQGDSVATIARDSVQGLDTGFVTGLPSTRVAMEEIALRMNLADGAVDASPANRVAPSPNGYDLEAIARAPDGSLYLADEMGPRLLRVDPVTHRIVREWTPGDGLPRVLARRRSNRGLEALCATPSGLLAGLMQGGLYNTVAGKGSDARDRTRVLRFFLLDPATDAVREHVYLADLKNGTRDPGEVKIGAMACLGDSSFLVVEHGEDRDGRDWIDIHRVDVTPATTDVHEANDPTGTGRLFQGGLRTLEEVGYIPGDSADLVASGVVPLRKQPAFSDILGRTAWPHDTPEGLALVNDSTIVLLNDNDYALQDDDGDGIPHLVGATRRLTHLMYLNLRESTAGVADRGPVTGPSPFTVLPTGPHRGTWIARGPAGTVARLSDARGRVLSVGTASRAGEAIRLRGDGGTGVYLLELRAGTRRETRRLVRW